MKYLLEKLIILFSMHLWLNSLSNLCHKKIWFCWWVTLFLIYLSFFSSVIRSWLSLLQINKTCFDFDQSKKVRKNGNLFNEKLSSLQTVLNNIVMHLCCKLDANILAKVMVSKVRKKITSDQKILYKRNGYISCA